MWRRCVGRERGWSEDGWDARVMAERLLTVQAFWSSKVVQLNVAVIDSARRFAAANSLLLFRQVFLLVFNT